MQGQACMPVAIGAGPSAHDTAAVRGNSRSGFLGFLNGRYTAALGVITHCPPMGASMHGTKLCASKLRKNWLAMRLTERIRGQPVYFHQGASPVRKSVSGLRVVERMSGGRAFLLDQKLGFGLGQKLRTGWLCCMPAHVNISFQLHVSSTAFAVRANTTLSKLHRCSPCLDAHTRHCDSPGAEQHSAILSGVGVGQGQRLQ